MHGFGQRSSNLSEKLTRRDPSRNRSTTSRNKTTGETVSIGMAAVNSPTDIERRSELITESAQPVHRLELTLASTLMRSEVKTLLLAAATLALVASANLSPAMAQGPKLSGGNTWPGISQRVDSGSTSPATTAPHYEYQYGYDHHAAWRGHWVLVR